MTEQNALVWEGGQVVKLRPVPVPESRPGWVAVDIAYVGICSMKRSTQLIACAAAKE